MKKLKQHHPVDSMTCRTEFLSRISTVLAAPSGLIKEEYIHDCIQMDLPPGVPLSDHQAALKLPPPDHYVQPLQPLAAEPHGPPPVSRFSNLPVSPKGEGHGRPLQVQNHLIVIITMREVKY